MATSAQTRPEPMNSSPYHPKVKVSMTLAHPIYVAGKFVAGKMEVECRADKGLGIGVIMVELFAVQDNTELTSRDHSATSTFLHSRRLYQGPDLPPSNAVQAHPLTEDPPYPPHYHQARRGISTFLFRIPIPSSAPSSINFGSDLARVRYELRATAGVVWKGEKTLVVCKRDIDVVESFERDFSRRMPEGVVVGEFGKIWVQGSVVGGMVIAGESACLELQVKNHSNKKNTGLTLSLTRSLVLPGLKSGETSPLQISDNLTTVSFRGSEYIIAPGAEGVASLVFDVPEHARGVRAGPYEGDESENSTSQSIFEVRCILGITINMGLGTSKNIHLDIPVPIVHPDALPEPAEFTAYPPTVLAPLPHHLQSPYAHSGLPMFSPIPGTYIDPIQNQVWLPPPSSHTPHIGDIGDIDDFSPPVEDVEPQYYFPPPPQMNIPSYAPTRPMSAGSTHQALSSYATGLDATPIPPPIHQHLPVPYGDIEPQEGKGERAMRVTQHIRMSSRHRSVSPQSHRFPLSMPHTVATQTSLPVPPSSSLVGQSNPGQFQSPSPAPLLLPAASPVATEPLVHSPRPFLSPKRSFDSSLPKSDRVEELERMAEEVKNTTVDLSFDLPNTTFEAHGLEPLSVPSPVHFVQVQVEPNINKTLPVPPPVTKKAKDKETPKLSGRTRIDEFFATTPPIPTEHKAPKTPMAAVTPVKLPFKPKSAELKTRLDSNGQAESGLDALEKRLLAEVGTPKMELENERRSAWSIVGTKPIAIPSKDSAPDDSMNDSAISSLKLAGDWTGNDREEVEFNGVLDVDAEHDSDEKTHRAGKSTVSAGSRKDSKGKGDKGKKKGKKDRDKDKIQDRGKDEESHHARKKKTAAAKGRVAAWLGAIDPDVPPEEDLLPPSPAVSREIPPFTENKRVPPSVADGDVALLTSTPLNDVELKDLPKDGGASAPNPRSSGFVPIATFKPGTLQRPLKPLSKDATVVREAERVADIWSASAWSPTSVAPLKATPPDNKQRRSPALKDVSPVFASIFPTPQRVLSIQTNRKVASPSAAGPADLGAKCHNINTDKAPNVNVKSPNLKKPVQQSRLVALATPQSDPEVKYDVRSARGGRGGRVTAITSFWAAGALSPSPEPTKGSPASSKTLRNRVPDPVAKDTSATTSSTNSSSVTLKHPAQTSVKSLLTASAPTTLPPNPEPKPVEFTGKRPRPIIKSTSVPAIISSSHAIPTLSSTASLARATSAKPQDPTGKLPPVISEARPDSGRRPPGQVPAKIAMTSSKLGTTEGEMAFGQARLRDLIKKYQG
ncbi:hypothetical protein C0995_007890 [Termitomyces sp. Mi166|nr:hypothetical protein C0995_007890 [Termitomyces sp. Mi166\